MAVGALSDLVLITIGVTGIGTVFDHALWALGTARWLGIAFLTWYAVSSPAAYAAGRHSPRRFTNADPRRTVILRMAAPTWLNPLQAHLDTVVLIGSARYRPRQRLPVVVRLVGAAEYALASVAAVNPNQLDRPDAVRGRTLEIYCWNMLPLPWMFSASTAWLAASNRMTFLPR